MPGQDDLANLEHLVEQWGREVVAPEPWVTLAEAEAQAGVSRSTLRAWYRSGRIPSRLMPGPHGLQRLVPLDVVGELASRSPRPARQPDADQPAGPPASDAVVRLAELATTVAGERAKAAEARAERAEAALRAALERAAAAEAEVRTLRNYVGKG